jgi:hypothetical protein
LQQSWGLAFRICVEGGSGLAGTPSGVLSVFLCKPGVSLRSTPGYLLSCLRHEEPSIHCQVGWKPGSFDLAKLVRGVECEPSLEIRCFVGS